MAEPDWPLLPHSSSCPGSSDRHFGQLGLAGLSPAYQYIIGGPLGNMQSGANVLCFKTGQAMVLKPMERRLPGGGAGTDAPAAGAVGIASEMLGAAGHV